MKAKQSMGSPRITLSVNTCPVCGEPIFLRNRQFCQLCSKATCGAPECIDLHDDGFDGIWICRDCIENEITRREEAP